MNKSTKQLADEYGNMHKLSDKLASGGQGVVFRTVDPDLAVKQPLNAEGELDKDAGLRERFKNIRLLPLPPRIPISMPLAILRDDKPGDESGYVMRLLNEMKPFSHFFLDGKIKNELGKHPLPKWLMNIPDKDFALKLLHYADTGSTRRRLHSLAKCASILARLHCAGLVYGDISSENVFVGEGQARDVWLIDADNLRFELDKGGKSVFTPHYGAPEVVRGRDQSRPRTDCWAFTVLAFMTIALCHPFIGKKVLEPEDEENGWDAEPASDGAPADLDEQAYAGFLPFVDDKDDDSNAPVCGLPRELTATPELNFLFQETFGAGRTKPHRRPSMAFWALELTRASDKSLVCPDCKMSYFADSHKKCPYCASLRPAFVRVKTQRWEIIVSAAIKEFILPHRLFNPFSFEYNDNDTEYEALFDFSKKSAQPVRGGKSFPENIVFVFEEAVK